MAYHYLSTNDESNFRNASTKSGPTLSLSVRKDPHSNKDPISGLAIPFPLAHNNLLETHTYANPEYRNPSGARSGLLFHLLVAK